MLFCVCPSMKTIAFSAALPLKRAAKPSSLCRFTRNNSCRLRMAKKSADSSPNQDEKRKARKLSSSAQDASLPESPEDMLLRDLRTMRAKRKYSKNPEKEEQGSPFGTLKSAIDTVLLLDFFLVVALLGWLAIALVPHFASKNDVLLDPWLGLWQPFIQPVLGVLMLGTIVQGTLSFINSDK